MLRFDGCAVVVAAAEGDTNKTALRALALGLHDGVCVCAHVSVDRAGESESGSVRVDMLLRGNKPGLLAARTH